VRHLLSALFWVLLLVPKADASSCLELGKDHTRRREFDKAATFLECAREEEPNDAEILSLLAVARSHERQYVSAGAAFQLGIVAAVEQRDSSQRATLEGNRAAVSAQLYNRATRALHDWTQKKELLDYPAYSGLRTRAWGGSKAITDTTYFPPAMGNSSLQQAAYFLELASYVDPTSADTFEGLSRVLLDLGYAEDALRASQFAVGLHPDDQALIRSLRVAQERLKH